MDDLMNSQFSFAIYSRHRKKSIHCLLSCNSCNVISLSTLKYIVFGYLVPLLHSFYTQLEDSFSVGLILRTAPQQASEKWPKK